MEEAERLGGAHAAVHTTSFSWAEDCSLQVKATEADAVCIHPYLLPYGTQDHTWQIYEVESNSV